MRSSFAFALAFAALIVAVPSFVAGKAPQEVHIFTVDGSGRTVTTETEATNRFGELFWAPWNSPSERMPEGTVLPYRYVLLLKIQDYRYVYFYMPGRDGALGYYFQVGSPSAAWAFYPEGIDDHVLAFAPPASGDAQYVVGDPRPTGWVPWKTAVPPSPPLWPFLMAAVIGVGAVWTVRRSRRQKSAYRSAVEAK